MLGLAIPIGILLLLAGNKAKGAAQSYMLNTNMLKEPTWSKWDALFKKYGTQYGVDWRWLKAICMTESALGTHPSVVLGLKDPTNPSSVSDDKLSWGLMQIRVVTANDFEKGTTFADLNDPEKAVRISAKFFAWLKKQFPNDSGSTLEKKVIMSYNQGAGATKQGKTYAAPYYEKFLKHMALINSK
ncbi:MAG: transglycosylase SLT domain-containing protein [Magnetococcus sp. YQC-3]